MGFSSKVIQQAIREQAKGKVPDLNRIKREQQEAERRGKLYCRWGKDRDGRLAFMVCMEDMYGREQKIFHFPNMSRAEAMAVKEKVDRYSRINRNLLASLARNPVTVSVRRIQNDLEQFLPNHGR